MDGNYEVKEWRKGGFIIIFFVILFAFVFVPHFVRNDDAYVILQFSFFALMFAMVYSLRRSKILAIIEIACVIPFFIFDFLSLIHHSMNDMLIAYGFSCLFFLLVIYDFTRSIIYSSYINTNLVFGSLIVYCLVGILWGKFYFIQNALMPGSFHTYQNIINFNNVSFEESYNLQFNFIYYSFSVLTTLGLGDIFPLQNQAKALTFMEAIVGQVFLGTIIAKLVSAWRQPNLDGKEKQADANM